MAEPKHVRTFPNRRLQRRFTLDANDEAVLRFRFPSVNGVLLEATVRDISLSGVSIALPAELPGLKVGDILRDIDARVAGRTFAGDLLVMHLTPGNEAGATCGGLFYPQGDEDLITVRLVIRGLDAPPA